MADALKEYEYEKDPLSEAWDVLWNAPIGEVSGDSVVIVDD
jgi:hypothetical protein